MAKTCAPISPQRRRPPARPARSIRFARARVGYKAPEEIVVLDDALNATGKVDRVALKRMAEERLADTVPA